MAKTHKQFLEELSKINPDIEPLGEYTKALDRIEVKCKKCDYIWNPKTAALLQGRGCPKCRTQQGVANNHGKTHKKTTKEFSEQLRKIEPNITVLGRYVNTHTNIECKCKICGHEWEAKPYSLLQGHGCPRCAKSGTSFMEQFIKQSFVFALDEESVLSRNRSIIGMELDVVIPSLCLAIEPGNWYLHKKSLIRDTKKREKCKEAGIRLITIYDKFPDNEIAPFPNDCFTFPFDLNKADRNIIKKLVYSLFDIAGISKQFNNEEWMRIEQCAYSNAKAKTHEDFVNEMQNLHPTIQVLGTYQNSNKRITVKCKKCGFVWDGVPAKMLAGDGCKKCGTKVAHLATTKSHNAFVNELAIVNPDVEIIGEYKGRHSPVKAKCKICGYEWEPMASSLLRGSSHKGSKTMHKKTD